MLHLGAAADRDRPHGRPDTCPGGGRAEGRCRQGRCPRGREWRRVGGVAGDLDAGEGAAAGAAAGAAKGRRQQKKAGKEAEAQAQQTAQTQDAGKKDTFKKAWGACLEGRGYTVK